MKCSFGWNRNMGTRSWGSTAARAIWSHGSMAVVLLAILAPSVYAQTVTPCSQNCTIQSGKSFSVAFDAPTSGGAATGYRLFIDHSQVGPDIAATAGTTTIPNQILTTPGTHTIEVEAFNAGGTGPKTPALQLTITVAPPGAPTNLRILIAVVVAENGTMSLKFLGLEPGVP